MIKKITNSRYDMVLYFYLMMFIRTLLNSVEIHPEIMRIYFLCSIQGNFAIYIPSIGDWRRS